MKRLPVVALIVFCAASVAAAPRYEGRSLVDVIAELQQRGLTIVYSTDLVKSSMKVVSEPKATSDRELLDEILAPHALATKSGGGGVISIVRASTKNASPSAPAIVQPIGVAAPVALANIVVTASNYSVLSGSPEHRDFMTRDELNRSAHLGDDLFRALAQLPGAASTDMSAAFRVRGGEPAETLVLLDGLEIADPFHLKYFQNAISIIDSDAIGSLDYLSGGFPVEYGNTLSGVIDMTTASPQRQRHTYAGISFSHARVVTDGNFAGDRGEWLLSLRRGYFDLILGIFYPDIDVRPKYGDIIGKVQYRFSDRSVASANILVGLDRLRYEDSNDKINAKDDSEYAWVNVRTAWTPKVFSQSVFSLSRVKEAKVGSLETNAELAQVNDSRSFTILGLRQDWTLDRSDRHHFVKLGVDAKHFSTRYDYASHSRITEPFLLFTGNARERSNAVSIRPHGTAVGLYAADRIRLLPQLTVEGGLRYERESWMSGDDAVTPRVNVVFMPAERTAVRASWGEFRQAQRLDAILAEDGDVRTYPAQRSRQAELAVEHRFGNGLTTHAAVYRKTIATVRPRYENLFDHDEFFPEIKYDRVRVAPDSSFARGVELVLKDDSPRPVTWWLTVAKSKVEDRFGEQSRPRSWDQPIAVSANVNYRRNAWNANLSALVHTGWPTTPVAATLRRESNGFSTLVVSLGTPNSARLGVYRRYDARVMHTATLSRGVFRSWIELTNILNKVNPCCIGGFMINVDNSTQRVSIIPDESGIGWLPSFGVAWEF
jgi:outer membrane receptor protein involved in Fe transport